MYMNAKVHVDGVLPVPVLLVTCSVYNVVLHIALHVVLLVVVLQVGVISSVTRSVIHVHSDCCIFTFLLSESSLSAAASQCSLVC